VRTHPQLQLRGSLFAALLVVTGCSSAHHAAQAASEDASPAPLHSCETREFALDGADVIVVANIDGSLASVVATAPEVNARMQALDDVRKEYGQAHRDTRVITRQGKWGIVVLTDACGHPTGTPPKPGE
jgi:hypothetical protein